MVTSFLLSVTLIKMFSEMCALVNKDFYIAWMVIPFISIAMMDDFPPSLMYDLPAPPARWQIKLQKTCLHFFLRGEKIVPHFAHGRGYDRGPIIRCSCTLIVRPPVNAVARRYASWLFCLLAF